MSTPRPAVWSDSVGTAPFRVVVYEHAARGSGLYLRWRDEAKGNWEVQSLRKSLLDADGVRRKGKALKELLAWALGQAEAKRQQLIAGAPDEVRQAARTPLTLGASEALVIDEKAGKYRRPTRHRHQVQQALRSFVALHGPGTTWRAIRKAQWRAYWLHELARLRTAGHSGLAETVHRMAYVTAIAQWLRDEEHIDEGDAVPRADWRKLLLADWEAEEGPGADATPARPRHTADEVDRLLAVAESVEPRIGLLLQLGAEVRARTQVLRAWRSHLDLAGGECGTLRVPGLGKKRGGTLWLTAGQRAAIQRAFGERGYLRVLEARYQVDGTDYPLFPGGKLTQPRDASKRVLADAAVLLDPRRRAARGAALQPATPGWAGTAFRKVETAAQVAHVPGRAFYGVKRQQTDRGLAEGLTGKALAAHGLWASEQMPLRVYADQQSTDALREAMHARARIRGEAPSHAPAAEQHDATPTGAVNETVNANSPRAEAVHGETTQLVAPQGDTSDA